MSCSHPSLHPPMATVSNHPEAPTLRASPPGRSYLHLGVYDLGPRSPRGCETVQKLSG